MENGFQEARQHLLTLRDWIRFAVSRFNEAGLAFGHGSTNAWDEAAYLIQHTLHLPLDRLEAFIDARLTPTEMDALTSVLKRRIEERIPAAYITREAWLSGYRFYVDERVIVPRSFIAELLQEQLSPWVHDPSEVRSALDLCTGSGCLAVLLAMAFSYADVDAVDLSPDALEVARQNVNDYGLTDQIRLVQSDLFAKLEDSRYDLIISNPPYVDALSMQTLPEEYLHEPRMALAAGDDGLDIVRRILRDAPAHLNPHGILVVEVGHNRLVLEEAFPHLEFTWLDTSGGDEHVFLLTREQLLGN